MLATATSSYIEYALLVFSFWSFITFVFLPMLSLLYKIPKTEDGASVKRRRASWRSHSLVCFPFAFSLGRYINGICSRSSSVRSSFRHRAHYLSETTETMSTTSSAVSELGVLSQPPKKGSLFSTSEARGLPSSSRLQPLTPGSNEIRLLTLFAGSAPEPLRARIFHVSMEDKPIYKALSYEWGDPSNPGTIMIDDDYELPITKNLAAALMRLRLKSEDRIMWIDAICIDQSNVPERNEQVSKMADIYRNAEQVLVWIGEESDDSWLALVFFQRFKKAVRAGSRHYPSSEEVMAVCLLAQRTYWMRAWIVQEILCARESIIYCGPKCVSWQEIECFFETIIGPSPLLDPKDGLDMFHSMRAIGTIVNMSAPDLRAEMLQEPESILQAFGRQKASDPRDNIFATVGLLRELQIPGFVDYSKTYECVCIEAAGLLLVQTRRLDFICHSQHRIRGKNVCFLPSWVPDWTFPPVYKELRFNFPSPLALERQTIAKARVCGEILISKGLILGSVQKVGRPVLDDLDFNNNPEDAVESFYDWQNILASIMPSENMFQDSFISLFTGRLSPEKKAEQKIRRQQIIGIILGVDNFLRLHESLPQHLVKYQRIDYRATSFSYAHTTLLEACMIGRRLVVTSNGNFGLAPNATQVGDIVCHLLGCLSPIILRPNGDSGYIHMGYTDIADFMEGEAMVGLAEGKYELQEFEIH